ncbi:exodeoxyribonuclease III [bacterium]|nr:exodeoxyribonuclease III [bacterium]
MKIVSWNVNGVRAVLKKGFLDFLRVEKPDVVCVQEIKIAEAARLKEKVAIAGWQEFWNSAERPGYSGTAVLVKKNIEVQYLPKLKRDNEGRVQALEFSKFILVNVYFPNANHELSRLDFKIDFNDKLLRYAKKLEKKKPVIICGDFNVAHNEIDLARPKENVGNPGFHPRERAWMNKFLRAEFVDTFRVLHPEKIQYSWWSYRVGVRARNVGWRIDYFCVSAKIVNKINKSFILNKIMGSDHCPVGIEI